MKHDPARRSHTPLPEQHPVFLDPDGRRWRHWRRGLLALGVVSSVLALVLVLGVLLPPLVPALTLAAPPPVARRPHLLTTRLERERLALRRRLQESISRRPAPPARHPRVIPAVGGPPGAVTVPAGDPIVAGFYVNWQDNSFQSLLRNEDKLDWVVCEWTFIAAGGDSLLLTPDRRVFDALRILPENRRPALFTMVSNFDTTTKRFSAPSLRAMLVRPAARARVVAQLADFVRANSLAGVTVDFEDVPADLDPLVVTFVGELRATMQPLGHKVTQAVPTSTSAAQLRRLAAVNDYLFAMVMDEHYQGGAPGPVASQAFYASKAREMTQAIGPAKTILMVAAYGYDWDDADPAGTATTMTFQETMRAAREHGAVVHFDSASLNPYVSWTDPDSTDHVLWYLDGATAYDQIRAGRALGAAGHAIWRLGGEDPALWNVFGREGLAGDADGLRTIPPGYEVEFSPAEGGGEILRIDATPAAGERTVTTDASGAVVGEQVTRFPVPYEVERYGWSEHRVALTFDDGPDGRWTPMILDTLASRGAPATFFVIGQNVEAHLPLMRRIYRDGHEVGNHTFSHPNLSLTSDTRTKAELDLNARAIEAAVDHRSAFFRPPYFGDAAPTTPDELDPVSIASRRGYYTIGLRDDSEDWQPLPVATIVHNVIAARDSGNIVLLHDGGGDRSRTVAALGQIIDSLRARGDTLVLVSDLAGLTRDAAMPPLPAMGEARRVLELLGFGALGVGEWVLYWVFFVAVILGIARLVVVGSLAVAQRLRGDGRPEPSPPFAPPVSVVVPAFNEGKVIIGTVASLLRQRYAGAIEILVVDDGSTDDTYAVARQAFGDEPQVVILHKGNGGKASALNFGIERASHDVVIGLDADTVFASDTIARLVQPLADPAVGAVAGNAKVGNRVNLVTRWQALEYVTSQNFDRRAFALVNGITVVPGAVGAWRRALVREVGGFRGDTLAEDQDLTLRIRRAGHAIAYADGAVAYTEAPDTLAALAKQRFRWSFGTLQCAWKHRDALFRPRYGSLGMIALPNTWLFQLLLPAISPVADLMFLLSLVSVALTYDAHGATYALASLEQVLLYYAVFLVADWLAAVIAFLMEPGEERKLTWQIFLQRFAYRQVMYWVVVRAFKAAFSGRIVGWGKLERKATVEAPA